IISDVIGNRLDVIASGPTYPDSSTFRDAYQVLGRYNLLSCAPESIVNYINRGLRGEEVETPKTLTNCRNYIIGDSALALQSAAIKAGELGLRPIILTSEQKGEVEQVARLRADEIKSGKYAGYDAILIGGETTVRLPESHGRGGRNQHYAAVSLEAMASYPEEWVLLSLGTDGTDFLPDVAGAIVDSSSLGVAKKKGIDPSSYLQRCDSYTLLEKMGNSLVRTGDTGTNVGDVIVYLLK
ncbi:MAG: MOFRL family protein, partial [Chloroflexota bacterium]